MLLDDYKDKTQIKRDDNNELQVTYKTDYPMINGLFATGILGIKLDEAPQREYYDDFINEVDRIQQNTFIPLGGDFRVERFLQKEKEKRERLDKTDPLQLLYPKHFESGKIAEARAEGYSNEEIMKFLNQRELLALSEGYSQSEIDNHLGRSRESRAGYGQYILDRQAKAYFEAQSVNRLGERKYDFDEVKYRLKAAAALKLNPGLVLDNDIGDEIMKRIEPHVVREVGFLQALSDGWERDRISSIISEIGYNAALGARNLTEDEQKRIENLQMAMPKIPINQYSTYKFAEGTSSMARQQLRHWAAGANSTGGKLLFGAGILAGAAALAMSGPFGWAAAGTGIGAISSAPVLGGVYAGVAAAMSYGSTMNTLKGYAGNAYLEYLSQGVPPDIASKAALAAGTATLPLNFVTFKNVSKYIPGIGSVFESAAAPNVSTLLADKSKNIAVKSVLKEFSRDTIQNALNNALQEVAIITGGEIAKNLAGLSSDVSLGDHVERTWDAFMALIYSAPLGSLGLGKNLFIAWRTDKAVQSFINTSAENLQKLGLAFSSPADTVIDQTAAVFFPVKDVIKLIGDRADPAQNKVEFIADSLSIPLEYAQKVLETGEGEIAVNPEAANKFLENLEAEERAALEKRIDAMPDNEKSNFVPPKFDAEKLRDVMRVGSRNVTAKEYLESVNNIVMLRGQSILDADTPFAKSARKVQMRMYSILINIKGQSQDLAKANSRIYATLVARFAEMAGLMPDAFDALHGIGVEGQQKPARQPKRARFMYDPDGNIVNDRMEGPEVDRNAFIFNDSLDDVFADSSEGTNADSTEGPAADNLEGPAAEGTEGKTAGNMDGPADDNMMGPFNQAVRDDEIQQRKQSQGNKEQTTTDEAWYNESTNVIPFSTINKMKSNPNYEEAKGGNRDAAFDLVQNIMSGEEQQKKMRELAEKHPDAILLAVHAEEKAGRNAIPLAIADYIGENTGLKVDDNIVQTVFASRTGSDQLHRLTNRPKFDGEVQRGAKYILIDDVVSRGGTFSELRYYIESNGGIVVGMVSIGASIYSAKISLSEETKLDLQKHFGVKLENGEYDMTPLINILKELDLYDGKTKYLTNSEAKAILNPETVNAARNRRAEARQKGSTQVLPGTLPGSRSETDNIENTQGRLNEGGLVNLQL